MMAEPVTHLSEEAFRATRVMPTSSERAFRMD